MNVLLSHDLSYLCDKRGGRMMKIDTVFSGGGVKAFAFIGALQGLSDNNIEVERVAGTSAGAIVAAFVAAGYDADELNELFSELKLQRFLDAPFLSRQIPFTKWIYLYFNMGLYKGDVFEKWLYLNLAKRNVRTFGDLPEGYLKIIVSDISLGKLVIIPDDLQRIYGINPHTFSVAKAVRMSASYPYLFAPQTITGADNKTSLLIDGGILSNFPLWIFQNNQDNQKELRPVLGITLSDSLENIVPAKINNSLDMLHALFNTMILAHDARYISKTKETNIIFIPVKHIKSTQLKLTDEDKAALIHLGKEKSTEFLKSWP